MKHLDDTDIMLIRDALRAQIHGRSQNWKPLDSTILTRARRVLRLLDVRESRETLRRELNS